MLEDATETQITNISDSQILKKRPSVKRVSPIMVEYVDPYVPAIDLARTLEAGANIIKLSMAFSTYEQKIELFHKMSGASKRCHKTMGVVCPAATCIALKTWMKKIGYFEEGYVDLIKPAELILTSDVSMLNDCTADIIYVDYPTIAKDVPIGMEITLGLGEAVMHCISVEDSTSIKCKVFNTGRINSLDTAFFRNLTNNSTPFVTKTDIEILKFCSRYEVNIVLVYYPNTGEPIRRVRNIISKQRFKPRIFSGICDQAGIDNIDDIIKESDGIVLCRNFLLYQLDTHLLPRLPFFQKWVAGKCMKYGKPMFITGVFDHILMDGVVNSAELADASNAVMEGVSGFVLRNCLNIEHTLLSLQHLNEVCCQVEPFTIFNKELFWRMIKEPLMPVTAAEAAAMSCVAAAHDIDAKVIVVNSISGRTAELILWFRPVCIVICVCSRLLTAKTLYTYRNTFPLIYTEKQNEEFHLLEDRRVQFAAEFAVESQWMKHGDKYVSLQRSREGHIFCDTVKVHIVTFHKKTLVECSDGESEEEQKNVKVAGSVIYNKKPKGTTKGSKSNV